MLLLFLFIKLFFIIITCKGGVIVVAAYSSFSSRQAKVQYYKTSSTAATAVTRTSPPECIYLGCSCLDNLIKCPGGSGVEFPYKMSMFPKRRVGNNYLPNLTIDLSHNMLEQVPDDRFAGLDAITLNLSHNAIGKISPDSLRDMHRLVDLDLSFNRIKFISTNVFLPVKPTLATLNLSSNDLYDMEPARLASVFLKLHALRHLSLAQNNLYFLPPMSQLDTLHSLDLRSNLIEFVADPETGKNMLPVNLIELNLENNKLRLINEKWFSELHQLKYLNLEGNEISQISEHSFDSLRNLVRLNLNRNFLKHVPSKLFFKLVHLDHIELRAQQAKLNRIDDFAFDRQSNHKPIRLVDLSHNHISVISYKAFCSRLVPPHHHLHGKPHHKKPYANIKEIDLRHNLLNQLHACSLRQLAKGYRETSNHSSTYDGKSLHQQKQTQHTTIPTTTTNLPMNRPKPLVRTTSSTSLDKLFVECNCNISRSRRLVDLDGYCLDRRGSTRAYNMNNYECAGDDVHTAAQVNLDCYYNHEEFECHQDESAASMYDDNTLHDYTYDSDEYDSIVTGSVYSTTTLPIFDLNEDKETRGSANGTNNNSTNWSSLDGGDGVKNSAMAASYFYFLGDSLLNKSIILVHYFYFYSLVFSFVAFVGDAPYYL